MARRKSRRKRRKRRRTRRYNKRRRRRTRRRRKSRRRGGMAVGMNTVNLQIKAKHAYASAEAARQKDKGSILWEKGDGKCYICGNKFGKFFGREHHCRSCGKVVCDKHSKKQQRIYRWALHKTQGGNNPFRECDNCFQKENEAIKKVSGKNENVAIAALRRAMFENCKNSKNRKEMIENCRNRFPPRLPSSLEIKKAAAYPIDEETKKYLGSNWTVRKQINKIYKPKKKEEEKETDIMFGTTAVRGLGLNRASQRHQKALSRVELQAMAKKQQVKHFKTTLGLIPTAEPLGQQDEWIPYAPPAEKLGNVNITNIPIARQGGRKTRRRRRRA